MDGSMIGYALVGGLGLTLVSLGLLTRHDGRFYAALVRHVEAQRRLRRDPPLTAGHYERDRCSVGTGLVASGWVVVVLGLLPLIDTVLRP